MKEKTCVHFNGVQHDECRAGVVYTTLVAGGRGPGWCQKLPCLDAGIETCPHRRFPTPEEVAAREEQIAAAIHRMALARAAIRAHTGGKRGIAGEIPCPACEGGMLRFTVSGYNGHIHANCTTEGCARWME